MIFKILTQRAQRAYDEVMRIFHIKRVTFHNWLKKGVLNGFKVGKRWLFYEEDIKDLLKQKTEEVKEEEAIEFKAYHLGRIQGLTREKIYEEV